MKIIEIISKQRTKLHFSSLETSPLIDDLFNYRPSILITSRKKFKKKLADLLQENIKLKKVLEEKYKSIIKNLTQIQRKLRKILLDNKRLKNTLIESSQVMSRQLASLSVWEKEFFSQKNEKNLIFLNRLKNENTKLKENALSFQMEQKKYMETRELLDELRMENSALKEDVAVFGENMKITLLEDAMEKLKRELESLKSDMKKRKYEELQILMNRLIGENSTLKRSVELFLNVRQNIYRVNESIEKIRKDHIKLMASAKNLVQKNDTFLSVQTKWIEELESKCFKTILA